MLFRGKPLGGAEPRRASAGCLLNWLEADLSGRRSRIPSVRRDWLEARLLDELQNQVLKRDAIEYVLDEFGSHVKNAFAKLSSQLTQMRERKEKLEGELRRLAATAAETGPSAFLIEAIHERE